MNPAHRKFTAEHEWIVVDGDEGIVGITDYAQSQLGDMVFVELPEMGRVLDKGGEAAVLESVKAASEVYAPVAGKVTAVNETLAKTPALVNEDPYGQGWILRLRITNSGDLDGLMDQAAYDGYVQGLV